MLERLFRFRHFDVELDRFNQSVLHHLGGHVIDGQIDSVIACAGHETVLENPVSDQVLDAVDLVHAQEACRAEAVWAMLFSLDQSN